MRFGVIGGWRRLDLAELNEAAARSVNEIIKLRGWCALWSERLSEYRSHDAQNWQKCAARVDSVYPSRLYAAPTPLDRLLRVGRLSPCRQSVGALMAKPSLR